jgi:hypothetical protein
MLNGLSDEPQPLKPATGTPVQRGYLGSRHAAPQPLAQDIRKQLVIAVPAPFVVKRDEEQVGAL